MPESQAKFQAREFPLKARNVQRRSKEVMESPTASKEEKARAKKALAAASRVLKRLGKPSAAEFDAKQAKGSKAAPGTKKKKGGPLDGIRDLLPGKFRGPSSEALKGRKAAESEKVR